MRPLNRHFRLWSFRRSGALVLLCAGALAAAGASQAQSPVEADPVFRTVLRRQGEDGVHTHRIPGLAATPRGTLIAVFDVRHRHAGDLPADIDVGMMRSTDRGRTWSPMRPILDYDRAEPGTLGNGVGDPAVLVDRRTGHVWVAALWSRGNRAWHGSGPGLTPEETGQLVLTRSKDDGLTWSAPLNITARIRGRDPKWRLCFNGPGSGIQLRDGTLVFAAQYRDDGGVAHSCFLYSSDGGENWSISPPAIPNQPPTSEAQVAELADGSVLISMRDESRSGKRAWARYAWEGELSRGKWSEPWSTVPDPTCMASLVSHPEGMLVFSNPNSSQRRVALTVRTSRDGGRSWSAGRLLDPRPSAYSSLAVLPDGSLGVLYECGDKGGYETLTFAHFPRSWLR